MRKETNEAFNTLTQDLTSEPINLMKTSLDLVKVINIVGDIESDLRDCVNELCLKCGNYREQHLGACNGCRWKEVKDGFYQD